MRTRLLAALAVLLLAVPFTSAANLTITPTTTLAAETGNNTSTASTFVTSTNGNLGAGNVSKQPLRDLIYPAFSGQVFVNWVPWWGQANHINIGYSEANPAQLEAQVNDMISRGVDGLVVDWWHAGQLEINTELMLTATQNHPPFTFALMYDASQLSGLTDPTQRFINDLNFAAGKFYPSSSYLRVGGKPVMVTFGIEQYSIDWSRVQAGLTVMPVFVFRNSSGYSKPLSTGAFAWGASVEGTSYLDYFYQQALLQPSSMLTWGAAAKGFNDSLAAWGQNRYADQLCGQNWLSQIGDAGTWYSASPTRLNAMQVATWNDYEEGTEIESGIDNCVTVSASMSGTSLIWAMTGQPNTVHHYSVFISTDGVNLMSLGDQPVTSSSLDLSQYQLAPGAYTLYVKAVGQASLRNQMSGAVSYVVADAGPTAALTVTPTAGIAPVAVTASTAGSIATNSAITSSTIDFGDGSVMNGPTATHTYSASGAYVVKATITDNYGKSATATAAVNIAANQPPLAALSMSPAQGVAPVTVTASTAASSDPDGTVASSVINFGDGTIAAGPTVSHVYKTAGTYAVTATVTDNLGASSSTSGSISVAPAGLTLTSPASGGNYASPLHVVASAVSGNPINAIWIYVDSVVLYKTSSSSVDTYLTLSGGSHYISAQAWDSSGAVYVQRWSFTINTPPVAALSLNQSSAYAPATVTASTAGSTDSTGTITASTIDFGDGTVMSGASASHAYKAAGTYTVTATVTDSLGQSSSTSKTVTVKPPTVVMTAPTSGAWLHSPVHVVASAYSGATVSAMWIYVDSTVAYKTSQSSLDTYVSMSQGMHSITVKAWDVTGALFTSAAKVNIY